MTSPDLPAGPSKAELRIQALAARDALEVADRLAWDKALAGHVLALPELQPSAIAAQARIAAGYWQMRSEADPRPIMAELAARGAELCLPAVVDGKLRFRRWKQGDTLVPGGFGTLVPAPEAEVVEPDLLIVPLAAFDARACRIGYGKGYYDRAIGRLKGLKPITTVGIAYAVQQVPHVPEEPFDQRLDVIVTENGVAAPL